MLLLFLNCPVAMLQYCFLKFIFELAGMTASFFQTMLFLVIAIAVIVLLTARFKIHAFFALLAACFVVGLGIQMPVATIINNAKDGFGNIMKSLGFIIVLGTTLGLVLQYTGCTNVIAGYIGKITGKRYAALAMSITGFVAGLPVFCDSGYMVLSGLNLSVAKRTGTPIAIMSVSLATGLYSVHCLIPPHPGATAAAVAMGADFGKLLLIGIVIALPAMLAGHWWANFAGKKMTAIAAPVEDATANASRLPSLFSALLPIIVPIILIAIKSFLSAESSSNTSFLSNAISVLGDPVIALSVGVLLAFATGRSWTKESIGLLLSEAAEKAGGILVIIGAGGAFGAVLAAAKIGAHFSESVALGSMGLVFPFLITAVLKTAQGSSTVAIITAASIVLPLLPALGLASANGRLLCVLSMGGGSMMLSHANDAYFWVIAKFSGLDMKTMLKVYTISSALMGLVTLLMVWLVSLFML
jgi:GntP family gluconate:H+ symporter